MHIPIDRDLACLVSGLAGVLTAATIVGHTLRVRATTDARTIAVANVNARIVAWWVMCGVVRLGVPGTVPMVVLFGLLLFLALGEFITLTPSRRADHHALLVFYVAVPLQDH